MCCIGIYAYLEFSFDKGAIPITIGVYLKQNTVGWAVYLCVLCQHSLLKKKLS